MLGAQCQPLRRIGWKQIDDGHHSFSAGAEYSVRRSKCHPQLSFAVDAGDNVAIIGPNGAGKTVLLKALLGLLPFRGEIRWSPGVKLGYVPQKVAADRKCPFAFTICLLQRRMCSIGCRSVEALHSGRLNI